MVMTYTRKALVGAALIVLTAGSAYAAPPPKVAQTDKGPALVNARGMTLYTYDNDGGGKSTCYGKCAVNWPPLDASPGAVAPAGYSLVTRKDGSKQWAHKGQPLYNWIKDKKPGDTTGDGVAKTWHVARP